MENLNSLTTFDLAFALASGIYSEKQKFEALSIIKSREIIKVAKPATESKKAISYKKPLKGSKSEKIQKLLEVGKSAKEIYNSLKADGTVVYYPEIYRLINKNSKNENE